MVWNIPWNLRPHQSRVLLREWFLIQPGNGRPCLALAHKSQTCQCIRHSIMSMTQTGTKPAWPEALTCVPTTGLDTSQHSAFATPQTSFGASRRALSSLWTCFLWPNSPNTVPVTSPPSNTIFFNPFCSHTGFYSLFSRRTNTFSWPFQPFGNSERTWLYIEEPLISPLSLEQSPFPETINFQITRCISTKYQVCFRSLLFKITVLFF